MTTTAAAVYEHGVLRPLAPLPLTEGSRVEVTVTDEEHDNILSTASRTGAELAQLWPALPHLAGDEAAAFEHDLAVESERACLRDGGR